MLSIIFQQVKHFLKDLLKVSLKKAIKRILSLSNLSHLERKIKKIYKIYLEGSNFNMASSSMLAAAFPRYPTADGQPAVDGLSVGPTVCLGLFLKMTSS